MTTLPTYKDYGVIEQGLLAVRARRHLVEAAGSALALVAGCLGALLAVASIEGLFHLPGWGRLTLLVATGSALFYVTYRWVLLPLLWRYRRQEVARYIEERLPGLRNSLINSVQLAHDPRVVSPILADRAISESAALASKIDLRTAVSCRPLWVRLAIVAGLAAALLLFAALFPGRITNAVRRVLRPTDQGLAIVGSVRILAVTPGNTEIGFGEPLEIHVKVDNPSGRPLSGRVVWEHSDGERSEPLTPVSAGEFFHRTESVEASLRYSVWVEDSRSDTFAVTVVSRPVVETVDLEYEPPRYTGLAGRTETGSRTGRIEAPEGTQVRLRVHPSRPVARGEVRFADGVRPAPLEAMPDGFTLAGLLRVTRDVDYAFYLEDRDGRGNQELTQRQIRAVVDKPPTASIIQPPTDGAVAPGSTVELGVHAADDYGLAKAVLWMRRNEEQPVVIRTWDRFAGREDTLVHTITLDSSAFRTGEKAAFWVQVLDNCEIYRPGADLNAPANQLATSGTRTLTLRDPAEEAKRLAQDVRSWQLRVEEILTLQKATRDRSAQLKGDLEHDRFAAATGAITGDQISVQKQTAALVVDMEDLSGQVLTTVRTALALLARNDMVKAVGQADELARSTAPAELVRVQAELLGTQDRIIQALTRILGALPAAVAEQLGQASPERATSMPADARKKWEQLADKLKEFADQQKKVISDTADLAKKGVDDFTAGDDEKLKDLAVVQAEWAQFLKEAYKDLSKIPDQDFSNSSLLKELLEVTSDVEKAADALTKKATEIAVPLEQSGVENAEELTTHIEKWLPDTADRDQWKMEEPLKDLDAPMAELPKELEDLIGDLMEQEEDLFDEIEDTSSAWADSLDKGAGWDAMDGPISNMSAQGVTGNRLPNSSEIGGRSGEGRTGKSSGEMVEEQATGKGGRRTPTRLTPDPYEKGEVQDSSQEGAGGATGGGKVSGAGEEGLEGPVPPPVARKMERLAGKQAALRNTAERVQIGFKVLNYPHAELDRAITVMKQLEDDLANHRYRNVLRRKEVLLKGLHASRLMVKNRIAVQTDKTATLPPEIQKEVLDSSDLAVPPEYEDLVKRYYESLAEPPQ